MSVEASRSAHHFDTREEAVAGARGHYPVDFLVAFDGDRRHPSQFAETEGNLRSALFGENMKRFGKSPLDQVDVWLPGPAGTVRVMDPRPEEMIEDAPPRALFMGKIINPMMPDDVIWGGP